MGDRDASYDALERFLQPVHKIDRKASTSLHMVWGEIDESSGFIEVSLFVTRCLVEVVEKLLTNKDTILFSTSRSSTMPGN